MATRKKTRPEINHTIKVSEIPNLLAVELDAVLTLLAAIRQDTWDKMREEGAEIDVAETFRNINVLDITTEGWKKKIEYAQRYCQDGAQTKHKGKVLKGQDKADARLSNFHRKCDNLVGKRDIRVRGNAMDFETQEMRALATAALGKLGRDKTELGAIPRTSVQAIVEYCMGIDARIPVARMQQEAERQAERRRDALDFDFEMEI